MQTYEIIQITPSNINQTGFFCYMSKRKTQGYQLKREWLDARFSEGMKVLILHETGGRDVGFIEYTPGEYSWRAVHAPGWMIIHCLWVVGKGKGKGYGARLVEACLEDARAQGMHGVAMVTSDGVWLAKKDLFLRLGFKEIDNAPPSFQLMAYPLTEAQLPSFPTDWDSRLHAFGPGLTVIRTPQCPYIENAVTDMLNFAEQNGISARQVTLNTAQEVQNHSPSAYGIFAAVLDGSLFSYHYLLEKDFNQRLAARTE